MAARKLTSENFNDIANFFGLSSLKDFQKDVIYNVTRLNKDCLVCVPTGSGKSLCYEALALAWEDTPDRPSPITLLISPLSSLIKMQVEKLNSSGLSAVSVVGTLDEDTKTSLESCSFRYLVGNPESFLDSAFMKGLLQSDGYRQAVRCLVFDEVHTAVSWGTSVDSKPAFRQFFAKVGDLRAKLPGIPILCLTATASKTTLSTVKQLLAVKNALQHIESPDRPNIRLFVKKVNQGEGMNWIVDGLQKEGKLYPKTIVYCRSIQECAELYRLFEEKLGKNTMDLDKRLFDMVHSKTVQEIKNGIVDRFMASSGELRVVFATKILGMGINIQCSQVVHYGAPGTVDDYIQQIGRAGRDGTQSHAILLFHGKQLRNLDVTMRKVVKNGKECLRKTVLEDFHGDIRFDGIPHLCCNSCAHVCTCGGCMCGENQYERFIRQNEEVPTETEEDEEIHLRDIEDSKKHELHVALTELRSDLDKEFLSEQSLLTPPSLLHGLDDYVIQDIIDKADQIYSVDDVINKCSITVYLTACQVVDVFSTVFGDVDCDVSDHQDQFVSTD